MLDAIFSHFRNKDGEDILFTVFLGFSSIAILFCIGLAIWGLIVWLGVYVVLVPVVVAVVLAISYAVGIKVLEFMDSRW